MTQARARGGVEAAVEAEVGRFLAAMGGSGHAGLYFEHLATGAVVQVNGDQVFPAASVIKVPVLIAAYREIEAGWLDPDSLHRVPREEWIAGSGVLKELHAGIAVTLRDLLTLMIIVSDNTATNLVINLVGLEKAARVPLDLGLRGTALRRLMIGGTFADRPDYRLAIDNTVTAAECGAFLRRLVEGRAVSPGADQAMLEIMARQQVNDRIPRLLPPGTRVAHKTGELRDVRHDAGVVYCGNRPEYILVVLTRGLADPPAAVNQVAELSRAIYHACLGG